jgi:hypothetical protein
MSLRPVLSLLAVASLIGCMSAWSAGGPGDDNLLKNGNFDAEAAGLPLEWTIHESGQKASLDRSEKPPGARKSLRVDVLKDAGERYGEILQNVKVKPATLYRLRGDIRFTQARLG